MKDIFSYRIKPVMICEDPIFYNAPYFTVNLYEPREIDSVIECNFSLNDLKNEKIRKQFSPIKGKCLKSYKMYILTNGL